MLKFNKIFSTLILILCFNFTSCYFINNTQDEYVQVDDNTYAFYTSDAMIETIVPLINKSFTTWHWNKTKFLEKYDKYYSNVDVDSDSLLTAKKYDCPYVVYIGKGSKYFNDKSKERKKFSVSGTYYLITEYESGTSTVFYER